MASDIPHSKEIICAACELRKRCLISSSPTCPTIASYCPSDPLPSSRNSIQFLGKKRGFCIRGRGSAWCNNAGRIERELVESVEDSGEIGGRWCRRGVGFIFGSGANREEERFGVDPCLDFSVSIGADIKIGAKVLRNFNAGRVCIGRGKGKWFSTCGDYQSEKHNYEE